MVVISTNGDKTIQMYILNNFRCNSKLINHNIAKINSNKDRVFIRRCNLDGLVILLKTHNQTTKINIENHTAKNSICNNILQQSHKESKLSSRR